MSSNTVLIFWHVGVKKKSTINIMVLSKHGAAHDHSNPCSADDDPSLCFPILVHSVYRELANTAELELVVSLTVHAVHAKRCNPHVTSITDDCHSKITYHAYFISLTGI